jgi:hypothetical protein
MSLLENLLASMDEVTIAKTVGIPHDEARMHYSLTTNTVGSFEEFTDVISDYYNYHVSRCVVIGGHMSSTEAAGRAKEILEQAYRGQGGNIKTAYNDAHDGTNGGLRIVLDKIAEQLKTESVERYLRDVFDKYVDPTSWEQNVEIMRQFLARYGHLLSSTIRVDQPGKYAQNYEELIRAYVDSLKRTSSVFRRF